MAPRAELPPIPETLFALGRHMTKHGRRWRTHLQRMWGIGKDSAEPWARQLRNQYAMWIRRQTTDTLSVEIQRAAYRRAAEASFSYVDGLEIPQEGAVSFSDEYGTDVGAYVQAWVWVPIEGAKAVLDQEQIKLPESE